VHFGGKNIKLRKKKAGGTVMHHFHFVKIETNASATKLSLE
jgi:hypothetical protein